LAGAGNASFDHEPSYSALKLPDAGYQLLALFRHWSMVEYFYPYRDIMADDPATGSGYWDQVLLEPIPRIPLAGPRVSYQQELMRFISKIHDSHAYLLSSLSLRPPIGSCQLPVAVRFVEGHPVVYRYLSETGEKSSGLQPGDIIESIDGAAVDDLLTE